MVSRRTAFATTWAAVAACVCLAFPAAAEPHVRAYVERTTVTVNKPFLLSIEVSGNDVGPIALPDVPGLNVNKRASSTQVSKEFSLVGTRMRGVTTQQLGYYAQATRTGKITIPRIGVTIDGKTLYTKPILLTVTDASQPWQSPSGQTAPSRTAGRGQDGELTWEEAVFIETDVDKREAYVGEPIELTMSGWAVGLVGLRVSPFHGQGLPFPTTEGFYATPVQPARTRKERNGYTYEVTEFHQTLYPMTPGDLHVGSWRWEGSASYRFQGHNFRMETQPIDVKVKPLPPSPPGFGGAVGHFRLEGGVDRTRVVQGVPVTLEITISGRGNPKAVVAPELPAMDKVFVSDPDKTEEAIETPSGPGIRKQFHYTITPLEAGRLTVPSVSFSYFDPVAKTYKTERTQQYEIEVLASAEAASPAVVGMPTPLEQGHVNVLGEDILPIQPVRGRLRPAPASSLASPATVAAPMLAYCGVALFMRRKRRFDRDAGFARDYRARSRSHKRLKDVASAERPAEALYRALVGFVADKFNVPEAGMTSSDAQRLFETHGLEGAITDGFNKILRACERANYASAELSPAEIGALIQAAGAAIDQVGAALKRGARS